MSEKHAGVNQHRAARVGKEPITEPGERSRGRRGPWRRGASAQPLLPPASASCVAPSG